MLLIVPYNGKLLREEIFVNVAILLPEEKYLLFLNLITSCAFSLDNINPKIYASFIFAKACRFAKFKDS